MGKRGKRPKQRGSLPVTVSVVIPAFDSAGTIERAVRSVMCQTFRGWDLWIVDDGSSDGTAEIVKRLAAEDDRIHLLLNGENRGVAFSRNRGVAVSKGKWIAFLDSDDFWPKTKLARQLAFAERTGCDLSYTDIRYVDEEGNRTLAVFRGPKRMSPGRLLRGNDMLVSSVLVRREWMVRFPFERDDLHEDLISWEKMLRGGCVAMGVGEPLVCYRRRRGSRSFRKLRSAGKVLRCYRYLGVPLLLRAVSFVGYALHGIRRYFFSSPERS